MSDQFQHPMLPHSTHDDEARQGFVRSFKIHLFGEISPGNRAVYDGKRTNVISRAGMKFGSPCCGIPTTKCSVR